MVERNTIYQNLLILIYCVLIAVVCGYYNTIRNMSDN